MKATVICLLLTSSVVLLQGCATLMSPERYPVYIRTEPKGAKVTIVNKKGKEMFSGTTPATVSLPAGNGYFSKGAYTVRLSLQGFEDKEAKIMFKLNKWYFGKLVIGGVVGLLIIDPITGAMWKIKDPLVDEVLERKTSFIQQAPELKIIAIQNSSFKETDLIKIF